MRRELPVPDGAYRAYKRSLLDDAVSDWTGVYEAWWLASSRFPGLPLSDRLRIAELAVRELVEDGLVSLYRGAASERPGEPVPAEEHEDVLRAWETWAAPHDRQYVWMAAVEPPDPRTWQAIYDSL